MMKGMALGRYFPGGSIMHRSDPRTKIILTVVFMAVVFLVESYFALLVLLLVTLITAKLAGKPLKDSLRGLRPILCLAVFTVLLNLLFAGGTPLSAHGILRHVSREGLDLSAAMVLRLILLVSGTSLLTFTSTPLSLTDGVEKLLHPLKRIGVPVHEIAMMLALALRFIPTLVDEAARIIKAQSSRSAEFATGNLLQKTRSHLPLLVPLFVGTLRRGDDLATAMEARCYRGGEGRTRMRELRFSRADLVSAGVMVPFLAALLLMDHARF